jgi:hypothetical protein
LWATKNVGLEGVLNRPTLSEIESILKWEDTKPELILFRRKQRIPLRSANQLLHITELSTMARGHRILQGPAERRPSILHIEILVDGARQLLR